MARVKRTTSAHWIARGKYLDERAAARRAARLAPPPPIPRPSIKLNLNRPKSTKKKLPPTPIETRRMKKQKMLEVQQQQQAAQAAQQNQANDAASSALSDADSEATPEDNIAVKHSGSATTTFAAADEMDLDDVSTDEEDNRTHDMNEVDDLEPRDTTGLPPADAPNPRPNVPLGTKGKEPARDPAIAPLEEAKATEEEIVDDEPCDEGEIDYNDYRESECELDPEDDVDGAEVIELSSDDGAKAKTKKSSKEVIDKVKRNADGIPMDQINFEPWKDPKNWTDDVRAIVERDFCKQANAPMNGSWQQTEDYQRELDSQFIEYIKLFPIKTWKVPPKAAAEALASLQERIRLRKIGVRVYQQPLQEYMHRGYTHDPRHHGMGAAMVPNGYAPHRPSSAHQQQLPYHPPQNGQMGPPPTPGRHMPPPPPQVLRSNGPMPNVALPQGQYPPHPGYPQQPQQGSVHIPFGTPGAVGGSYGMPQQQGMPPPPQARPQLVTGPNGQQMQVLPNGQPVGMNPHGHGHSNPGPAVTYPQRAPPGKSKRKLAAESAQKGPPPPTPPYDVRGKPSALPRKEKQTKSDAGKRNIRRQAEADTLPWNRPMDFVKAKAEATWDTSGYDDKVLDAMAETRRLNMPKVFDWDAATANKVKNSRSLKKGRASSYGLDGTPSADGNSGEGPFSRATNPNIGGDPYYSGNYSFATETDKMKAKALGCFSPDDVLDLAEGGKCDPELLKEIFICWNPGKKGTTQDLLQATFRCYDTLITRQQYDRCPILTKRAAECIIDFCPDMLWRECLLRIISEACLQNKDVRDRICFNGCYADKATVTKRIAAALGQKQQAAAGFTAMTRKTKAELKEEEEKFLDQARQDLENYSQWFGKKPSPKRAKQQKRKRGSKKADGEEGDDEAEVGKVKRARTTESVGGSSEADSGNSSEIEEDEGAAAGQEVDDDAVSIQSDGILDAMSDH